ncbi:MAG: transketolase C-terminal domain-containing protein, partial [Planctomycetota bacterium]
DDLGEVMRHAVVPGHIFEELGVTYVGPVNGHNVLDLVEQLQRVKDLEGCVLLHLLTEKGKGHPNAPTHPERVHGVKPGSGPRTAGAESSKLPAREQVPIKKPQGPAYTSAFADSLLRLAENDVRVHVVTAGMPSGTGLETFAERLPARFHDTGITEQHAVAFCAGMAKAGLRPVAAIYSTFLQRAYDQVFQEVALQNLPVLFCMDRAGLVGQDGPTHNGVFDLAYLRTLPNFVLASPRDATDMRRMLEMGLRHNGPLALRYPRANTTGNERIHASERRDMLPGRAEVLCEGDANGVVIWALGAMVDQALEAAERLAGAGIHIGVVDARFAKPLDTELLTQHALQRRAVITVEEHQRAGGFGAAVLECVSRLPHVRASFKLLAIADRYFEHKTTREEQLEDAGLDAVAIERAVRSALNAPQPV